MRTISPGNRKLLLAVLFFAVVAVSVYLATNTEKPPDSRFIAPQTFGAAFSTGAKSGSTAAVPLAAPFDSSYGVDSSRARPGWMTTTYSGADLTSAESAESATKTWLKYQATVSGDSASTGSTQTDIRSLLVRRRDGTVAEIPIMNFFRKLFMDHVYYLAQAKALAIQEVKNGIGAINTNSEYNNVVANNLVRYDHYFIIRQTWSDNHNLEVSYNNGNVYLAEGGGQHWKLQRLVNGPTLSTDTNV